MLKEIVDETSFGRYDFMYLRIGSSFSLARLLARLIYEAADFANNCKSVYNSMTTV